MKHQCEGWRRCVLFFYCFSLDRAHWARLSFLQHTDLFRVICPTVNSLTGDLRHGKCLLPCTKSDRTGGHISRGTNKVSSGGGGNVPQVAATNLSKYNAHHIPQIFFCNFLQRSETTTPQAVFPYATKPSQTVGIEYTNSKMRLIHTDTSILYVAAEVC